jgi:tetratricopeptide (TPR) repeat protein
MFLSQQGEIELARDQAGKAGQTLEQALEIVRAALGPVHPVAAAIEILLAQAIHALGRFDQAEPLFARGLAAVEAGFGSRHHRYLTGAEHYAKGLIQAGRADEAQPWMEKLEAFRVEFAAPPEDASTDEAVP